MKRKVLKRKDFIQLNKEAFFSGKFIRIYYRKTQLPFFRIGITVTKKWANSVKRNLFKRRVKNTLNNAKILPKNIDLQIKPKFNASPNFKQIQLDFETFFNKNLV